MNILGLNHYFHDSSACLLRDGALVGALEEERFNRDKHTTAFPEKAAAKCLEMGGIEPGDVDCVAVAIAPKLNWGRKTLYALRNASNSTPFVKGELSRYIHGTRGLNAWLNRIWPDESRRPRVVEVEHHLSHAVGGFLVSPFTEAALLGLDGSGEWATSYLGYGQGCAARCYQQSFFPMSLGSFFESATEFCGFRPNYDEGKTMGLAPYGDPEVYYQTVRDMVHVGDDGDIKIDLSYFNYQHYDDNRCGPRFYETFGQPRPCRKTAEFCDNHKNVAAAFQRVLEECALKICEILHRKSGCDKLVIGGGVALNSVMNGRIIRESPFKELYVMPGAGDNGTSIGAAYYAYNVTLGHGRGDVHDNPYVGNSYSNEEIKQTIETCGLPLERHDNIADVAAELVADGHIIGWHQGRMEFGPRALGSRSIIANPTLPTMKRDINAKVKHREAFRPFAPSVTVEAKDEFFQTPVETPFMLKVCPVRPEKQEILPAITHVDGSARLQTVQKDMHPMYHALISAVGRRTGVPVVLNTSFNVMGEPIVESPTDAVRCFFSTGLDDLVLGNYLIRKSAAVKAPS